MMALDVGTTSKAKPPRCEALVECESGRIGLNDDLLELDCNKQRPDWLSSAAERINDSYVDPIVHVSQALHCVRDGPSSWTATKGFPSWHLPHRHTVLQTMCAWGFEEHCPLEFEQFEHCFTGMPSLDMTSCGECILAVEMEIAASSPNSTGDFAPSQAEACAQRNDAASPRPPTSSFREARRRRPRVVHRPLPDLPALRAGGRVRDAGDRVHNPVRRRSSRGGRRAANAAALRPAAHPAAGWTCLAVALWFISRHGA